MSLSVVFADPNPSDDPPIIGDPIIVSVSSRGVAPVNRIILTARVIVIDTNGDTAFRFAEQESDKLPEKFTFDFPDDFELNPGTYILVAVVKLREFDADILLSTDHGSASLAAEKE